MTPYHAVTARLKKSWFFPTVMLYDIVFNYEDDRCDGGGWYHTYHARRTIATYLDRTEAEEKCAVLNELNGEKK